MCIRDSPYCGDGKLDSGEKCEQGNPAGVSCTWDKCNQSACTCLPAGLVILKSGICLLYTSDAADDLLCVDIGGRRINKKKKHTESLTQLQPS